MYKDEKPTVEQEIIEQKQQEQILDLLEEEIEIIEQEDKELENVN